MRLSDNIESVLLSSGTDLTVREVLARSEHKGFGFLLVILTLPIALPFTPPGISTPFGVLVILLAAQMILNREQPWFPERILDRRIKGGESRFKRLLKKTARFCERITRPRMTWLYRPLLFRSMVAPMVLVSGIVMLLPLPLVNTVSSGTAFLLAIGLLEEDGLMGMVGVLVGLFCLAALIALVVLLVAHGPQGWHVLTDWLVGLGRR